MTSLSITWNWKNYQSISSQVFFLYFTRADSGVVDRTPHSSDAGFQESGSDETMAPSREGYYDGLTDEFGLVYVQLNQQRASVPLVPFHLAQAFRFCVLITSGEYFSLLGVVKGWKGTRYFVRLRTIVSRIPILACQFFQ